MTSAIAAICARSAFTRAISGIGHRSTELTVRVIVGPDTLECRLDTFAGARS